MSSVPSIIVESVSTDGAVCCLLELSAILVSANCRLKRRRDLMANVRYAHEFAGIYLDKFRFPFDPTSRTVLRPLRALQSGNLCLNWAATEFKIILKRTAPLVKNWRLRSFEARFCDRF